MTIFSACNVGQLAMLKSVLEAFFNGWTDRHTQRKDKIGNVEQANDGKIQ